MGESNRRGVVVWSWTHADPTGWLDAIWPQNRPRPPAAAPARPAAVPVRPQPSRPARPAAEPRVHPDRDLLELCDEGHGCGHGSWCRTCRDEIRQEALRWIRELNAPEWSESPVARPHRPWHSELQ